ncbi:MAG: N-6 DNA methylase [Candidatus Eremiobacteraeota bacterium]|nr:N-6 DNA methylase [Candidatus Eremiobacteraeota bacterium]
MKKNTQINKQKYAQYFTPPHVVEFVLNLLKVLNPHFFSETVSILDPACGEGIFLQSAIEEGMADPQKSLGIDADPMMRESWSQNGLLEKMGDNLQIKDALANHHNAAFDLTAGNPPFGLVKISEENIDIFRQYEVFHAYLREKKGEKPPAVFPIEVLFLEKFIKSTSNGGFISIVIPEGILANIKMRYVRRWMASVCEPLAIISLDSRVFQATGVSARTSIIFLRRNNDRNPVQTEDRANVIMARAEDVEPGGKRKDDLDLILRYLLKKNKKATGFRALSNEISGIYTIDFKDMEYTRWDPDYHHPAYGEYLKIIKKKGFSLEPLGKFISPAHIFTAYKGMQGKACTEDRIPYLTSKQITDIGIDHTLDNSFIDRGSPCDTKRTRIREGDLLLVRSGNGCIGRAVVAGREYAGANVRSEIYILRTDPNILNPYYIAVFLKCFKVPFKNRLIHFQTARLCSGVGTPNLNKDEILSIMVPSVPMELQKEIEKEYREIQEIYHKAVIVKEIKKDASYLEFHNEAYGRMRKLIKYVEGMEFS